MSEEKKQRLKEYQKKYCTAKENCSKSCYGKNKEAMKEKSRECYNNLSQEEKDKIKGYQRKTYQELVQYKKQVLKNK